MGRTRRSFTKEFKREVVRRITEGGQNISQVGRDLGIRDTVVGRWKRDYDQDGETAFPGTGHLKPEDGELRQLRRENERLRMERDILKKAAAIFSKDFL